MPGEGGPTAGWAGWLTQEPCVLQGSLSTTQLQEVQRLVEEAIVADQEVYSREVPLRNARTIPGLRTVDEVGVR